MTTASTPRVSAEERRGEILEAALSAFAEGGLHGTSTEDIAARVGISQPYLFRLFRTKKELFIATVDSCHAKLLTTWKAAVGDKRGEEALQAMGEAYAAMLAADRRMLLGQMQSYAACDDPDVRRAVSRGFGELVAYVEDVSGAPKKRVSQFFAKGMLLNVVASMNLTASRAGWAERLVAGCREE